MPRQPPNQRLLCQHRTLSIVEFNDKPEPELKLLCECGKPIAVLRGNDWMIGSEHGADGRWHLNALAPEVLDAMLLLARGIPHIIVEQQVELHIAIDKLVPVG